MGRAVISLVTRKYLPDFATQRVLRWLLEGWFWTSRFVVVKGM